MAPENDMTLSMLRSDPNFASLSQFFHTFQAAFRPWPNYADWTSNFLHYSTPSKLNDENNYSFATEDLEKMLIDPSLRYQLEDLILRLLRFLTRNRFINASTWQDYFAKEWDRRETDDENPFRPDSSVAKAPEESKFIEQPLLSFFDLPLETRLNLLNTLCEWQLDDPERLREHMDSEEDPTQWRVDPLGYDANGNTFWLFDDNRLYKESAPKKKKKSKKKAVRSHSTRRNVRRSTRSTPEPKENFQDEYEDENEDDEEMEWTPWKLVCMTVDDWQQFPTKYSKSKHSQNQQFHQLLVDDVLPKVIPVIEEHGKNRKKQEALAFRKRSSRILVRDLEALEQRKVKIDDRGPLSRIEKRRLEIERLEKERQSKAREKRLMERERRVEYKARAEEIATEKSHLAHEQRLPRRHGTEEIDDRPQQQEFKIVLKLSGGDSGGLKANKKGIKRKTDNTLGKKKRGRKPKYPKQDDEETWIFNCSCGAFGRNIDDGTPMIACEKCNEWQHIECLRKAGHMESNLLSFEDYAFVCRRCMKKANNDLTDVVDERRIASQIQKSMAPLSESYTNTLSLSSNSLLLETSHHYNQNLGSTLSSASTIQSFESQSLQHIAPQVSSPPINFNLLAQQQQQQQQQQQP
ncbi:hypothetical protein BC941DRAFT_444383 [Chlamydoabsidia padenii]|nr:hypothetical protein BC941DRAFT_444383 [Chlamydoabsidia padenii]